MTDDAKRDALHSVYDALARAKSELIEALRRAEGADARRVARTVDRIACDVEHLQSRIAEKLR